MCHMCECFKLVLILACKDQIRYITILVNGIIFGKTKGGNISRVDCIIIVDNTMVNANLIKTIMSYLSYHTYVF